tara:strand:+ start:448 stop:1002 length:555 start_codon:yes stop_codon:yes gene_type:complete
MGRPKASPEQQLIAYELYKQGFKPKAITINLEQEFPEPVSLSTVEKWCRRFRDNPTGDKFLDSPFQWEEMEKAGIPWEAGEYLLGAWKWLKEEQKLVDPTYRHMKWWWRVHLAAPKLPFEETLQLVVETETYESGIKDGQTESITERLIGLRKPTSETNTILSRILKARTRTLGHSFLDHLENR